MAPTRSKVTSAISEAPLSRKLNRKLAGYATAATAAGVGVLAFAQPAAAKIVFTPTSRFIPSNSVYKLDVNHDGIADFIIQNSYACNSDYCYAGLSALPQAGNGVEGAPGFLGIPYAFALKQGATIGSSRPFSGKLMLNYGMGSVGRWKDVRKRYLGLKFQINGTTHFGWARLTVGLHGSRIIAYLSGFAYETTPNTPIVAGQTSDDDVSNNAGPGPMFDALPPQPASLGLLARGAEALSLWRRD